MQIRASCRSLTLFHYATLFRGCLGATVSKIYDGDSLRPDLVLVADSCLYILKLTVGLESNIQINSDRRKAKYHPFSHI